MLLAAAMQACNDKSSKNTNTATADTTVTVANTPASTAPVADTTKKVSQANDSIFPGKSIGNAAIGEKMEDVVKLLGQPDDGDAAMGKAISIWRSKAKAGDSTVHTFTIYSITNFDGKDETPRVKIIRATSPFFKTAEGVGSGSTLAFIKAQYPAAKKPVASYTDTIQHTKLMIYEASKEGIAFEINETTGKCAGVIVHVPGDNGYSTYLPMFPGLKKL